MNMKHGEPRYGLRPMKSGIHGPVTGRVDSTEDARSLLKHHEIILLVNVPATHPKFEQGRIGEK